MRNDSGDPGNTARHHHLDPGYERHDRERTGATGSLKFDRDHPKVIDTVEDKIPAISVERGPNLVECGLEQRHVHGSHRQNTLIQVPASASSANS